MSLVGGWSKQLSLSRKPQTTIGNIVRQDYRRHSQTPLFGVKGMEANPKASWEKNNKKPEVGEEGEKLQPTRLAARVHSPWIKDRT